MLHLHLIPQNKALEFMTAGNATFTLKSLKTGTRFTYKITVPIKDEKSNYENLWFVKLLTGNDNENDYSYMCHIKIIDNLPNILTSTKSRIGKDAPGRLAFNFVFKRLLIDAEIQNLEIWHEGRCCRCGRKLTVPESIEAGIGPECAGKISQAM